MEEKKKKKQEEKIKKDIALKKAAEQKSKVPEPAPTKPSPGTPHHFHPASPTLPLSFSFSSGNDKRTSCSSQLQSPTAPQPQCPSSSASSRYPPREVPPRFRQQEHKQLLKRGQPLPAGAFCALTASSSSLSPSLPHCSSSTTTSSTTTNSAGKQQSDISLNSSPSAENCQWGASLHADSISGASSWNQGYTEEIETKTWPSINHSGDPRRPAVPECPLGSASFSRDVSAITTASSTFLSMATGATGQPSHYTSLKSNSNMMTGPGSTNTLSSNRGWGSDAKQDGMNSGRVGTPNHWGSPGFNLNLNPSANPSAWPVLGHEGGGGVIGPNGVSASTHPPGSGNGNIGNGSLGGTRPCSGGWVSMVGANENEQQRPSTNTGLSFNMETNLNTDGPNHTKQQAQEPMSPIHGLTGWGGQSPTESSQLNGDTTGSSVWGSGEAKATDSPKDTVWDTASSTGLSAWGRQGSGGGGSNGSGSWGDWGKSSGGGDASKGWDSVDAVVSGTSQEQQLGSWGKQPGTAPASEGSGDSRDGNSDPRDRSSSMDYTPVLPRQDLDPRVLSNTGWGQTPIRQHTVWEMEEANSDDGKSNSSSDTFESSSSNSGSACTNESTINSNIGTNLRHGSDGKHDSEGSPGWGAPPPQQVKTPSGWDDPTHSQNEATNGTTGGWGDPLPASGPKNVGMTSWGSEDKSPSWDGDMTKSQSTTWGEGPLSSRGWGNSNGGVNNSSTRDWGEQERKNNGSPNSMWEGDGGNGGWKDNARGGIRGGDKLTSSVSSSTWGEASRTNGPVQGTWGSSKPTESSSSSTGSGGGGSIGSWGGPGSVKQNTSSWSKQDQRLESTGWEEPSPPSIRRKMEIDDGTSTWGDPGTYMKTVNMWDRNNPNNNPGNSGPPATKNGGMIASNSNNNNHPVGPGNSSHHHSHPVHHHPHHGNAPSHLHHQHHGNNYGPPNNCSPHANAGLQGRPPLANPGWGELPNVQPKSEPAWGEPAAPTSAVDNGTSAWGKPSGGVSGWGDGGHEPSGPYGRASGPSSAASCKPGPKPMQDSWGSGGDEMGMSTGQWDNEDGDMWSSPTSQESSSSCNSWGNGPKKGPGKGRMINKPDETWIMNRLIKQLTDMGFPRDPAEEALKSNNMNLDQAMSALLEKKTDLDKRSMGISDYSNGLNKPLVCRASMLSKDPSDRHAFLDKDGALSDDAPPSPFMPSPSLKLPLANSSLPGQGLGPGTSGLAMQNLNNRQIPSGMFGSSGATQSRAMQQQQSPQPPVPPLSSSMPSLRAQVPQFLSPQVQAQLLQFAAKNIGLNPALLTSPINPQQMTLLYQLQQLQMAYQRLQIQQQMMQAQRNVSGPIRQQEQQVARTITNMQQQIQQHQRQLYQALLMKQQQLPSHSTSSSSQAGLHAPGIPTNGSGSSKSTLDPFTGPHHAPGLADTLHTKEPLSSPNAYSTYPLSGLNPNMNVNCIEVGGLSLKEPPQPQSRLSQWTHSNSMDGLSGNTSSLENNLNKHGAISAASTLGPPGKPSQLDDSYSPYNLMSSSDAPASSLVPPDSWGQGKNPNEKITNGTNINWPPEFCPGVPWKGLQNIDPENDPNMTPGSVPSGPTINTNIQDVNRYLLRDRNGGKLSDVKSTWSTGSITQNQSSLTHELWKVPQGPRGSATPSRPPPGLTNNKPSTTWGGNSLGLAQGWSGSYTSEGTTWSTDSSNRTSSWLVLRNLTPQIDGSTLRTLCMQHGPLITFHLNLTQGNAVVRYSSKDEAAKAQKSLHMCVLGNTTILAEFAGEEEVNRFFAQGQSLASNNTTSWQANPGTNQNRMGGAAGSHSIGQWSSGGGGKASGGDLLWGGVPQYSSLWGPPSGEDARVIGSPTPINTLLPGDLLSGESM
ncbi:trinucleotide repeat-containing gene 6C protein-like isoform X1 [Corythoichthys intestinalis]|uniref:trinucleotide repeat-containing gene 6C protein-like isoform X1 n=1 Tax=Corythoichthys intestinalis TaxID=161448 RepID=UPI0025A58120|nr:trinucleotide repeat-containing gene 6C protein-like isoform X1 [Corythoichthys intestinalis]XP_057698533.1 trinucleotide repeat-containing gene 6C protein-like isoform X1 [Corythoichthys intestinalis]